MLDSERARRAVRLPDRLARQKMGVQPTPQRVWPRHRRWVRSHRCCVPGCPAERLEFAHIRTAANAGIAQKPHDAFGVSLCRDHHAEQHRISTRSFADKSQIDLAAIAAEFARRTPDRDMQVALITGQQSPLNKG